MDHSMCVGYPEPGCDQLATILDHIIGWSARGDMTPEEWDDESNWQGMCARHHDQKTADEARRGGRRG